jgi:ferredoxin-nitrate reductase
MREGCTDSFVGSSYEEAISTIAERILHTDSKRVGFYLSGQMLNEDYYVANKLAKGFVGTSHCDTNSRTCMASAVVGYKKSFGVDYVPVRIEDIDHANLLILIGANPAESHVVLFNRIKKAQKRGLKLIVIDPRETMTAKSADLYLPLKPNSDISLLNLLAKRLIEEDKIDKAFIEAHSEHFETYKAEMLTLDTQMLLAETTLSQAEVDAFFTLFIESPRVITAWTMGINQSSQGVDKNLAINNLHIITGQIAKQGCGPFSLTGQPNAMGGREVGGLSTTLAVHLDYTKENCQKVSAFWQTENLPTQVGLTAFEMIEAASRGELDVLIICHTDPVYHLPDRHFVEEAFRKIPLVVEINAYQGSETASFAHIQIPVKAFGEKEGTQTNMDRTLTRAEAFVSRDDLLQDWEVFAALGKALGYHKAFDFADSKAVFEEYQQMCRLSEKGHLDIYHAEYEQLREEPYVWGEGLFEGNQFMTPNGRAQLHAIRYLNLSEIPDSVYPFILLTGRIRDQWHTGSKTAAIESLSRHKPLSFVEMSESDAKTLGNIEGDSVRVTSRRGSVETQVVFSHIASGTIFIPLSHRGINYITEAKLDPYSKEPDYNHSAVRVEKI